ncbi:trigger factor [Ruminococcaceae bacterium OttesenSCG-928-O06]|nr:trigger factor [Ruminococcaceae bacterium OttesenSCG-928-O06]
MKLNKSEKVETNIYEIEFVIEPEQLREAISKVYRRDAKKYNVPGFRRGHAPRNRIEQIYGEDVFLYDAVNDIFPEEFEKAVEEAGLEAVGSQDVEMLSATRDEGAVLKAKVIVKPEIKLGKYTGLKAARKVYPIDESAVAAEIDQLRERNARLITKEGAAENGDTVHIDFEGFMDGEAFEGGKGEDHKLEPLGGGSFIDGFEEQIVGHVAGDEFDVNVTFPEEYHAENLAGKPAVFKVKLNKVEYKEMDEADDEFAKDVSEFDTMEEFRQSLRDKQQKQLDEQSDRELENALVDQIIETVEGEIPEVMYESATNDMLRDFMMRIESQGGIDFNTYMQMMGLSFEALRERFREDAEKQVKIRLAMEAIVKQENIVATDEDVDKEIERIAEMYSMEKEQVADLMPRENIAKDLAVNKAIDLVKEKAVIKDEPVKKGEADTEEKPKKAPAKKAAAKKPAKKAAEKPEEKPEEKNAEA